MDKKELQELSELLLRRRAEVFNEVRRAEADLEQIAASPEIEPEEKASDENTAGLLSRLDERGKRKIEEIDAALRRMEERHYGSCAACAQPIELARLRALPATTLCAGCARNRERGATPRARG